MGKIKLECLDRNPKLKKVAKAVYKVLGQKSFFKVEIIFQDGEYMQYLNKTTRGKDSITDVLSYPSMEGIRGKILTPNECKTELEGKYIFLGSIVLCDQKIREQAIEYGHSEQREREYLVVHGLLHLFDYDHMTEEDKLEMRAKEKQIMSLLYPQEQEETEQVNEDEIDTQLIEEKE